MADNYEFDNSSILEKIEDGSGISIEELKKINAELQDRCRLRTGWKESFAVEQNCMDRMMRQAQEVGEQSYQNRKCMQEAMERTAHNTGVTNERLEKIIDQQSSHIELLEKANETLQKQLATERKQLDVLLNIFASGEDGVQVEKELMSIIKTEIDQTHPLWEYVKDKGGDIAVAGATAAFPVLYNAFKNYLLAKGIVLP